MSRALASLSPAWVTNKAAYLAQWATMYSQHTAAIDTGVELAGSPYGYWTPFGGVGIPADAAAAETASHTADPVTDWDTGSGVRCLTEQAHFNTSAWATGNAA